MSEGIDQESRQRLESLGFTDLDLLTYLQDRESGLYHFVAAERLCSGRELTAAERMFISDLLRTLTGVPADLSATKI